MKISKGFRFMGNNKTPEGERVYSVGRDGSDTVAFYVTEALYNKPDASIRCGGLDIGKKDSVLLFDCIEDSGFDLELSGVVDIRHQSNSGLLRLACSKGYLSNCDLKLARRESLRVDSVSISEISDSSIEFRGEIKSLLIEDCEGLNIMCGGEFIQFEGVKDYRKLFTIGFFGNRCLSLKDVSVSKEGHGVGAMTADSILLNNIDLKLEEVYTLSVKEEISLDNSSSYTGELIFPRTENKRDRVKGKFSSSLKGSDIYSLSMSGNINVDCELNILSGGGQEERYSVTLEGCDIKSSLPLDVKDLSVIDSNIGFSEFDNVKRLELKSVMGQGLKFNDVKELKIGTEDVIRLLITDSSFSKIDSATIRGTDGEAIKNCNFTGLKELNLSKYSCLSGCEVINGEVTLCSAEAENSLLRDKVFISGDASRHSIVKNSILENAVLPKPLLCENCDVNNSEIAGEDELKGLIIRDNNILKTENNDLYNNKASVIDRDEQVEL